jgi:hypothetical protein
MRASASAVPIGFELKEVVGGRQTEQLECGTAELLLEFSADSRKLVRISSEKNQNVR